MSNADSPAAQSDAQEAGTNSSRLGELPERVRVHALAKLLGSSSREVLGKLGELGETARSPQSSVPRATAHRVVEMFDAAAAETVPASGPAAEPAESQPSGGAAQPSGGAAQPSGGAAQSSDVAADPSGDAHVPQFAAPSPVFLPPEPTVQSVAEPGGQTSEAEVDDARTKRQGRSSAGTGSGAESVAAERTQGERTQGEHTQGEDTSGQHTEADENDEDGARKRRRRGRRGRGRGKGGDDTSSGASESGHTHDDNGQSGSGEQDKQHSDKQSSQQNGEQDKQHSDKQSSQQNGKQNGKQSSQQNGKQDKQQDNNTGGEQAAEQSADDDSNGSPDDGSPGTANGGGESKRRRRRRRRSGNDGSAGEDPPNTVTHVREQSGSERDTDSDGVRSVRGSTRLEAKRRRRQDGREAGRRRAPVLSEAEFLARRESVERAMVVADKDDSTQIGVLEDGVLVEHFVTSSGSGSIVGNVYLGRVQNVLPSMEAAFIDIGRGRNAVLYAGEVDWDSAGLEGKARKIEQALTSGDNVLVQVSKDPLGHKGARLTTQISLPGRFLVYVPSGSTTGISRKLPENERKRLKEALKRVVPEDAGVIIRTASEGISEQELERDVQRLREQWEDIKQRSEAESRSSQSSKSSKSSKSNKSGAPALLYEEPELLIKVVRDLFTEDFRTMEIQGEHAWHTIQGYVDKVAPELMDRVKRHASTGDVFAEHRIDEQITKALDRKVWLPSGGYLVIDRTEAMTVIDVNTGKFTGSGGNLEETVTRNNLESAEEIVRQLRLRDIGGIIVIDFIDMVLESNRELVLRRLTECLGRDRTRHQVAEVTSLGLVQMTRKRIGTGLLESFSTTCEHCNGRGLHINTTPNKGTGADQSGSRKRRGKGENSKSDSGSSQVSNGPTQHQRESAANAVAVMANASKTATGESADSENSHGSTEESTSQSSDVAASAEAGAATQPETHEDRKQQETPERSAGRRPRRAVSRPAGPPV